MVPASLCPLRSVTALCHFCGDSSHPDLVFATSPGTQSTALGLTHLCEAYFQGFLCKGADLMVPASLCRLRAVTALCRICGDRSHPYLVCLTPPGTQSTALGLTRLCLALLEGFLCKGADRMVPASLCELRALTALCHTCWNRSHPNLVCLAPPGTQSTAFGLVQLCFAFL
jgi:hypothetical protein